MYEHCKLIVMRWLTLFVLVVVTFAGASAQAQGEDPSLLVDTVVIDPGHGGIDAGCTSNGVMEKDIVLAIALKLGKYIKQNLDGVEVIYTRTTDRFVKLYKRAEIANKNDADVFISLHVNASSYSYVHGAETFCMGVDKSEENLKVAKRENSVVLMEENYKKNYKNFDPKSPESHILFSMQQNNNLEQSLNLAANMQHQFDDRVNRTNRGVKQAGFVVLYKTTMPSVLVEAGFLTNPSERRYLTSDRGQTYIASGLFRAFRNYRKTMNEKLN